MKRDLYAYLNEWKDSPVRVPLILRGARQVGKTWIVREFSKDFEHYIEINFEETPRAKDIFKDDLSVNETLQRIFFFTKKQIIPRKTLLFLDEIQECPRALAALRYFKEKVPDLHVIVAGSLLEFALEKMGSPVGRVQFLHLYPLSFGEYLDATGHSDLRQYAYRKETDDFIHQLILNELKNYLWLGGMPEVIKTWVEHQNVPFCLELQDRILLSYRQDFLKYSKRHQIDPVDLVFHSVMRQFGQKFKYVHVDRDYQSKDLKQALRLLEQAGVVYRCCHSSGDGLPLESQVNQRRFKVFFLDIGLAQRTLGLDLSDWINVDINSQFLGGIMEQFIAQEYKSYAAPHLPQNLYYWHREAKSSNAEVDFLFVKNQKIIPVEVKSGSRGRIRSMHLFMDAHPEVSRGLRIWNAPFQTMDPIDSIPFYALEAWMSGQWVR